MTERNDASIELLKQLVSINSVNPDLVPGGNGEAEIGSFCAAWFEAALRCTGWKPSPGAHVSALRGGTGGGKSLMFNGHYDTVSIATYDGDALDPVELGQGVRARHVRHEERRGGDDGGRSTGQDIGVRGDILVACVADEEYASFGTEDWRGISRQMARLSPSPATSNSRWRIAASPGLTWWSRAGRRTWLTLQALGIATQSLRLASSLLHLSMTSGSEQANMRC